MLKENNEEKLFCRKCGAKLRFDSVFCDKCGTKVINLN
jgi:ribosomal protein L40E